MTRKNFPIGGAAATVETSVGGAAKAAPRILLRSGWQVENIGDIAHTPGMLALLEKFAPEVEVTFWPHYPFLPPHEVAMLRRRFPRLTIVEGALDAQGEPPAAVAAEMDRADFFLHNSGPATLGWREAAVFQQRTGRPFGVWGVSYGLYGTPEKDQLSRARFVYFRDSVSLQRAKAEGVRADVMAFGPDAAFALDVRDDRRAADYLARVGLKDHAFLVCIPKQRITPSWLHVHKHRAFDDQAHARNEAMREHDHRPLREAIVSIVRQTGMNVLIGHEDETQLPIGKTWLWDWLPDDVRPRVVWRDTLWTVEEAASIYVKSAGMFSSEMHSPIMCIAAGVPALVCRWEEQSSKGVMWRDIGLSEWLFDFDNEDDLQRLPAAASALAIDPAAAKVKAEKAHALVQDWFADAMSVLRRNLTV